MEHKNPDYTVRSIEYHLRNENVSSLRSLKGECNLLVTRTTFAERDVVHHRNVYEQNYLNNSTCLYYATRNNLRYTRRLPVYNSNYTA